MCLRKTIYGFVCLALISGGVRGATNTYTWTNTVAGTYNWDSANWDQAGYPDGAAVRAVIQTSGNTYNMTAPTMTLGELEYGDYRGYNINGDTLVFDNGPSNAVLHRGNCGTTAGGSLNFTNYTLNTSLIINITSHVTSMLSFNGKWGGTGGLIINAANGDASWAGFTLDTNDHTFAGGVQVNSGSTFTLSGTIDCGVALSGNSLFRINKSGTQSSIFPGPITGTGNVLTVGNTFDVDTNCWQGYLQTMGNFPGAIKFSSIGNVGEGPSALGDPQNSTQGKITLGGGSPSLEYTGSGDETDRIIDYQGFWDWAWYIRASGTTTLGSPWKITSDMAGHTTSGWLYFGGTGCGEWAGNLLAANVSKIQKYETGTWVLSGSNTFSGGLTLSAGLLNINAPYAMGAGTFTISGGTLGNSSGAAVTNLGGNAISWGANIVFAGTNDLDLGTGTVTMGADRTVTVSNSTLSVGGTLSAGSYTLTKAGAGTLNFYGATAFGSVTVGSGSASGGTLVVGSGGTLSVGSGSSSAFTINIGTNDASAATSFTANVGNFYVSGSATSPYRGDLLLSASNTITASTSVQLTTSAPINAKAVVTTPNSSTTTIYTPTMVVGNSKTGPSGGGFFTLGSGASLSLAGISGGRTALTIGIHNIGSQGNGAIGTLDLSQGTASLTLSSLIIGQKIGTGGTASPVNGTLTLNGGAVNHLDVSGASNVVLIGSSAGGYTVTGVATFAGLDATSAIASTNNSTAVLLGDNTGGGVATGTLNMNGGMLTITTTGAAIAGGGGTSRLNLKDCTLKAGASSTNWISGLTTATLTNNVTFDSDEYDIVVAQPFSGTGGFTKSGAGTLTLTATNTFTGAVVVSNGTLQLGKGAAGFDGSVSNASSVTVDGGAVLAYNLVGNSEPAYAMGGNGSLLKTGPGMLVLSNANTYVGSTTVSNGVLRLTATSALAQGTVVYLYSGATNDLAFAGTNIISGLYLDDVLQSSGSYGAVNVDYTNTAYFTGTGALCVLPPPIMNSAATEVGVSSARLNACLYAPGVTYDVYVHFGTSDGGTNFGSWATNYHVGSWTDTGTTNISYLKTGLSEGTTYYYTFRVTNATTNCWATPSRSFTTPTLPVVSTLAPTNIGVGSATLRGSLDSKGTGDPTVYTYWGASDGGTNKSGWQNVYTNGVLTPGVFTNNVSGLYYGLTYYYRTYATNAYGDAWAASSTNFTTMGSAGTVGESIGWSYTNWTSDANSGITNSHTYTAAQCFGNNHASVTVNGVLFSEGNGSSGTGWSIGGTVNTWDGDDNANITGESEKLAQEFVYNGNPRTIRMTNLTAGVQYKTTLFSVAWEGAGRSQTFASGGDNIVLDQDYYGDNNGIRISYSFVADSTYRDFTITPTGGNTFHMYALANRVVPAGSAAYSISNSPATAETHNSASVNGGLSCSGSVFNVYAHWNTSNGGTDIAAWTNSVYVGSWTNLNSTNISKAVSGLTAETLYYFTLRATNACTNMWATNVQSFTTYATPTTPVVNNDGGATNQTEDGCTLRGSLTNGGYAYAWICWGDEDGGTTSTDRWDQVDYIGTVAEDATFSNAVSGLSSNVSYWYRCYVSSSAGMDWSDTPASFNATPAGSVGESVTNSGGTVTNYSIGGTNYTAHIFTNNGVFTALRDGSVEVLVVAGGGGGGANGGGGGGAGGLLYTNAYALTNNQSVSVTIGGGGPGSSSGSVRGTSGTNSVFGTLTAVGGGGGASRDGGGAALSGGSGGGGGGAMALPQSTAGGGTTGQGTSGGAGTTSGGYAGGGGGAGTAGTDGGIGGKAGNGGTGVLFSAFANLGGSPEGWFAGGGAGAQCVGIGSNHGLGGTNGGGGNAGVAGVAATGGGGGGGGGTGGKGGFGIVIVRYCPDIVRAIVNIAPTAITNTSAVLNATLSAASTNYDVYIHWGTIDRATNFNWESSAYVGSWTNEASTNVCYTNASLAPNNRYYYTFRATNATGNAWATPSWQFTTLKSGAGSVFMFW